jgi:PAS domain S-box-containing protein
MTEHLDLAGVIFLVLRTDQTVESINSIGCDILGYTKEEIEGYDWCEQFVPAESRDENRRAFSNLIKDSGPVNEYVENFVLTRSGDVRLIKWRHAHLRDDDGKLVGLLSSGQDISDRKALQSRLGQQEVEKRKQLLSAVLEAQEDERREIAYELHDNVNQILTSCKLLLEQEMLTGDSSAYVVNTHRYLRSAMDEIRSLSHRLSPSQLDDLGLEDSIHSLIERANLCSAIDVRFLFTPAQDDHTVSATLSLSLLRIVQEHLNNIVKHSGATEACITLDLSGNTADLEVRDNGKGFDLSTTKRGLGINNVYNRTELHGGQAYINTYPGEGCTLSICIPLQV